MEPEEAPRLPSDAYPVEGAQPSFGSAGDSVTFMRRALVDMTHPHVGEKPATMGADDEAEPRAIASPIQAAMAGPGVKGLGLAGSRGRGRGRGRGAGRS